MPTITSIDTELTQLVDDLTKARTLDCYGTVATLEQRIDQLLGQRNDLTGAREPVVQ